MATDGDFVVVCTYAERDSAEELIAALRRQRIAAFVVPSIHVWGAWDVLAPARAAMPSRESLDGVLTRN